MECLSLRSGELAIVYDPQSGVFHILRGRAQTPWVVHVQDSASVEVRPVGGTAEALPVRLQELTLRRLSESRAQWIGNVGSAECAFEVEVAERSILFTVTDLGSAEAEVVSAVWPGEVRLQAAEREVCWSNSQQGALFHADGNPWSKREDMDHVAMRFAGLSNATESLAIIVETHADGRWRFDDDGVNQMTASVEFGPSMGRLSYPRRLRLVPLAEPGHVPIANAFRSYAQCHGLWMSWEERVAQNPLVAKLQGAFVAGAGYWFDAGADQVSVMRKMRDYGFTKGYLFSPKMIIQTEAWTTWLDVEPNRMSDEQIAEVQALGYLAAPFLQIEEADDGFQGGRYFATDADGRQIKRWQIGDTNFHEIVKWHVLPCLARYDGELQSCESVHFDTLTAMRLVEHHGERSYDKRGDAALRLDLAGHYRDRGKVIASESLRDWSVRHVDLGTSKSFCPVDVGDRRVWIVPLSDLVYHDSCVRVTWEHHPYDDDRCVHSLFQKRYHPFGAHLTNLLTCSPPVLFPEGMLYEYEHREILREDGEKEWEIVWDRARPYSKRFTDETTQQALPKALEACRLHEHHGAARMLYHRFPDPSYRYLQESEFASGLHVFVNFGEEDYPLPDGRTVKARSALAEE